MLPVGGKVDDFWFPSSLFDGLGLWVSLCISETASQAVCTQSGTDNGQRQMSNNSPIALPRTPVQSPKLPTLLQINMHWYVCVQEDNTQAALHMQKALELAPDSAEYASDLDRLLRRIPDQHVDALQVSPLLGIFCNRLCYHHHFTVF